VRYVGRLIRLAFRAPDIVDAIVEGRQPANLTPEAVTRHIEIPLEWRSQKTALNIQGPGHRHRISIPQRENRSDGA
jgi:site-specific DNA recombinase